MLKQYLMAGIGGAAGSMLRFFCSRIVPEKEFPLATLFVNLAGSLLLGLLLGLATRASGMSPALRLLLVTGFCGGFTTFSAFSGELMQLLHQGKYTTFILYILLSVGGGIGAAVLGYKLGGA